MLTRDDFIGGFTGLSFTDDEPLIDQAFEDVRVDGQPIVDLFYLSEYYQDLAIDFGGGVHGITCRDVISVSNQDCYVLREQLGLRNTKQNNQLCKELLDMCEEEIKRSGYLF